MKQPNNEEAEVLATERKILRLEERRIMWSIENTIFLPLFVLIFFVTVYTKNDVLNLFLFLLAIALIVMDLIFAIGNYMQLNHKIRSLDLLIKDKMKRSLRV